MTDVILQHFILPGRPDRPLCLYGRESAPGVLREGALSFDTYFNSFSLKKWRRYTRLANLWLRFTARGRFSCQITGMDAQGTEMLLARRDCDFAKAASLEMPVPAPDDIVLVFCRFSFSQVENFEFLDGCFFTRADEPDYVDITAIFCTYNREPYLEKNIRAISDARAAEDLLQKHFQVLIIDNGSNLNPEKYADLGATLLHNINAGGSGGFARGMLEVLEQPDTDYALLMDDDIELETESLFRMLLFLSLLKEEYREYFLGGTMFSLARKTLQSFWRERYDGGEFQVRSFNSDRNMCARNNILLGASLFEIENQYNGWWMCCIPVTVIRKQGLPMPFFMKWDDMEYSMRNDGRIMQLNGICVWHEDFSRKASAVNNFLWVKNAAVTALLTAPDASSLARSLRALWRDPLKFALKLNYDLLEAYTLAVAMTRKGPEHLTAPDELARKMQALREHGTSPNQDWETYQRLASESIGHQPHTTGLKKLIMAVTLNGHLLPACFTRQKKIIRDVPYLVQAFFADEITVVNTQARSVSHWRRDRMRFFRLLAAFAREWVMLLLTRRKLMEEYRQSRTYLTSSVSWRKQLGLGESDGDMA